MGGPLGSDYIGNWGAALGAVILLCVSIRSARHAYKGLRGIVPQKTTRNDIIVSIATFFLFIYFISAIWAHR